MITVKTFEDLYYINNTVWSRNLVDKSKLTFFDDIKYSDIIILHFDFVYSLTRVLTQASPAKTVFMSTINVCLRLYSTIKKIYPYNKVYVIIHTKHNVLVKSTKVDYDAFQSIINIIPNFALITPDDYEDLAAFKLNNFKHIFYGLCNNAHKYFDVENKQRLNIFNGKPRFSFYSD